MPSHVEGEVAYGVKVSKSKEKIMPGFDLVEEVNGPWIIQSNRNMVEHTKKELNKLYTITTEDD